MGKVAFSGPVYGAKDTLWSLYRRQVTAVTFASLTVPPGEEWLATELIGSASSNGASTASVLLQHHVSSAQTVHKLEIGGSTQAAAVGEITRTGGEVEGYRFPAGSTVVFRATNNLFECSLTLRGFTRYVPSTRG